MTIGLYRKVIVKGKLRILENSLSDIHIYMCVYAISQDGEES